MILFNNPYQETHAKRRIELAKSRKLNESSPYVDRIIDVKTGSRATFKDFFLAAQIVPWNTVCCISNDDISFEDSTCGMFEFIGFGECFALSRHEENGKIQEKSIASQDAWLWRGPPPILDADFALGKWACDNRIAKLIIDAGFVLYNPCLSIKAFHHHSSNIRRHGPKIREVEGEYAMVPPCTMSQLRVDGRHRVTINNYLPDPKQPDLKQVV